MPPLLELCGVHAAYSDARVLHGVDLTVQPGGITALLGANGAGKTTTLRAISATVRTTGAILFEGARIDGRATQAIARLGIGHVPDGRGTVMELSVEDNLRLGGYTRPRREVSAGVEQVFGYFPCLRQRLRQQAGTLSGGEQQMLAIGRALLGRPKLLLLDEPSFGLAPLVVQEIFAIMRRIRTEQGMAILLVEQNAKLALDTADHAVLLQSGRVAASGPAAMVRQDEQVRRSYLGH